MIIRNQLTDLVIAVRLPLYKYTDISSILDAKSNAALLLFDLSDAIDTVNFDLLLSKLSPKFVFSDVALEWFFTYFTYKISPL